MAVLEGSTEVAGQSIPTVLIPVGIGAVLFFMVVVTRKSRGQAIYPAVPDEIFGISPIDQSTSSFTNAIANLRSTLTGQQTALSGRLTGLESAFSGVTGRVSEFDQRVQELAGQAAASTTQSQAALGQLRSETERRLTEDERQLQETSQKADRISQTLAVLTTQVRRLTYAVYQALSFSGAPAAVVNPVTQRVSNIGDVLGGMIIS